MAGTGLNRELLAALMAAAQAHLEAGQAAINAIAAELNVDLVRGEAPISTNVPDEPEACAHPETARQNISGLAGPRKFFCRDCRRRYAEKTPGSGKYSEC